MSMTVQDMLNVYYAPTWDLARLCEASAVDHELDPAKAREDPNAIGEKSDVWGMREHTWHWCCTEPMQLMKVWSDLYQLRLAVPYGERQQLAPPKLFQDCLAVYERLDTSAQLIHPHLAKQYMDYILFIDDNTYYRGQILSRNPIMSAHIKLLCADGMHRQAVAAYIRARIDEASPRDHVVL